MKLRRPEFRKARSYKRRAKKRNPTERFFRVALKDMYQNFRAASHQLMTPFLACFDKAPSSKLYKWGGNGTYFDITQFSPVQGDDYAGHSAEGVSSTDRTGAVPVELRQSGQGTL